jgi:hypothetical protein
LRFDKTAQAAPLALFCVDHKAIAASLTAL